MFTACHRVDDLIDSREREVILWTMFVECGEMDAHTKYICIFLWDQNWISNPSRFLDFFNELGFLEPMKL
jgi:hypothetical protein